MLELVRERLLTQYTYTVNKWSLSKIHKKLVELNKEQRREER